MDAGGLAFGAPSSAWCSGSVTEHKIAKHSLHPRPFRTQIPGCPNAQQLGFNSHFSDASCCCPRGAKDLHVSAEMCAPLALCQSAPFSGALTTRVLPNNLIGRCGHATQCGTSSRSLPHLRAHKKNLCPTGGQIKRAAFKSGGGSVLSRAAAREATLPHTLNPKIAIHPKCGHPTVCNVAPDAQCKECSGTSNHTLKSACKQGGGLQACGAAATDRP